MAAKGILNDEQSIRSSSSLNAQARASRRRRWIRRLAGALAFLLLLLIVDYWAYPYGFRPGGRSFNTGENGLWLRYTWYFGKHGDADLHDLAQKLTERQIRYAYFHVRHVTKLGALQYRYPEAARRLVTALHRDAPGVRVLALLRETRAALPSGKLLSVATPMGLPFPLQRWGWSDTYFAQVAANCDQMAVLCYDSGFYLPRSYVWLVRQQAIHITQAARSNPQCRVLLGVPTYWKGLFSHNPRAENIGLALRGVREGLADSQANVSAFAGVAPFADYTTDADEWQTYRALWLEH